MSDNLDKLDFDVSYDIIFGKEEVDLIDIYERKTSSFEVDMPEDKFVTFSSNLIKCFKSKIKNSPSKTRTDTLIEVYRNAEETYEESENYTLSAWCLASVDAFLDFAFFFGGGFVLVRAESFFVVFLTVAKESFLL